MAAYVRGRGRPNLRVFIAVCEGIYTVRKICKNHSTFPEITYRNGCNCLPQSCSVTAVHDGIGSVRTVWRCASVVCKVSWYFVQII
jgi:hypothetical protein